MTLTQTMTALQSLGTAPNRKVYSRHGAGENSFGVSFANLKKLHKKVKTDHDLATELWSTRNSDAMILATMVADPARATSSELDAWVKDIQYYVVADMFSRYVATTGLARKKMLSWTKSRREFIAQAGYDLLSFLAMRDPSLPDAFFQDHLKTIEKRIRTAPNRTRHAMNQALISIGIRNSRLRELALAAAGRIGPVRVDHGETGCKTPGAAAYILKTVAYRAGRKNRVS